VGGVISYNGPWNYAEFREFCEKYYRDVIGSRWLNLSRGTEPHREGRHRVLWTRRNRSSVPYWETIELNEIAGAATGKAM
jgi:hypothetical protein